ncbi:hypothetical protein C2G38_2125225 [Gigaspora rosea]|uniref:Uncharacterized protein n=1 Tax=Gigaspora rosea TaxID=44941 RepID=A0A397TWL2_9GLOM|nr:hypothetical protein C2G38_2125225 [Gigaspora rosea]
MYELIAMNGKVASNYIGPVMKLFKHSHLYGLLRITVFTCICILHKFQLISFLA